MMNKYHADTFNAITTEERTFLVLVAIANELDKINEKLSKGGKQK